MTFVWSCFISKGDEYLPGLTYLDTLRGINPIIEKLPVNLQKWLCAVSRYKDENKFSFPHSHSLHIFFAVRPKPGMMLVLCSQKVVTLSTEMKVFCSSTVFPKPLCQCTRQTCLQMLSWNSCNIKYCPLHNKLRPLQKPSEENH